MRDRHAILTLEELPKQKAFGKELYPTIFDKAAIYARNIIMGHSFIDGNKRTAISAAAVFLDLNGYKITVVPGEIYEVMMKVANKKMSRDDLAKWFRKNCKKRGRFPKKGS